MNLENESFHDCDDELASTPEERLDEIIEDARQFLAVHPIPPPPLRKSTRIRSQTQPRNYSTFSKTGQK